MRGAPLPALLSTPGRHSRTADIPGRRANAAASSGLRETNGPERAPRGRAGAGRQAAAPGERGAAVEGQRAAAAGRGRAGPAEAGSLTMVPRRRAGAGPARLAAGCLPSCLPAARQVRPRPHRAFPQCPERKLPGASSRTCRRPGAPSPAGSPGRGRFRPAGPGCGCCAGIQGAERS